MTDGYRNIVRLIQKRDERAWDDALALVNAAKAAVLKASSEGREEESIDILYHDLGLELDYMIDLIL